MQDRTDYLSGGAENAEANAAETAVQTGGGEINGIFSAKEILKKRKHHHHEKRSPVFTVLWIIVFVLVSVWTVSLLYSLFWMLAGSLKDNYDFYFNKFGFPEFDLIAWDNYALAFNNLYVTTYPASGIRNVYFEELLFNTLYITLVSAFLSVFVPAIMGYVSAKYHFWFNKVIHFIVVFSIVVKAAILILSAVGLTAIVWLAAGAILHTGRPTVPGLLLVLPLRGEVPALEEDVRELRRVRRQR